MPLTIINRRHYDQQTARVFKRTCNEYRSHSSDREIQSDPEFTKSVDEALEARELIKIHVLQNCLDDSREMAQILAERTGSQVVQVIGRKIILYREGKKDKKKIILPKA